MEKQDIKAILFDSGRTLNIPRTSQWFITPKFFKIIDTSKINYSQEALDSAGVVSDTWPSLERVFVNRGLRKYFSTFIMSSIYGSYKLEKVLFKVALEELNIEPYEAIFIDDSESNLAAAEEFGMHPILIDRYDTKDLKSKYPIIRSLNELSKLC